MNGHCGLNIGVETQGSLKPTADGQTWFSLLRASTRDGAHSRSIVVDTETRHFAGVCPKWGQNRSENVRRDRLVGEDAI